MKYTTKDAIEIRLAELDGRCVHKWDTCTTNGFGTYFYTCSKGNCEVASRNMRTPGPVENPVAQSLGSLVNYAIREKIQQEIILTFSWKSILIDKRVTGMQDYNDYKTPEDAAIVALGNALIEALEKR